MYIFCLKMVSITIEKKNNNNTQQSWKKTKIRRIKDEKLQQIESKLWYHIKLKARKWKKRKPFLIDQKNWIKNTETKAI